MYMNANGYLLKILSISLFVIIIFLSPAPGAAGDRLTDEVDLWAAAESGNTEAIALILSKGADINGRDPLGKTPLIRSLAFGKIDCVKYLLSKGAEVDATDKFFEMTALQYASRYGYFDIVKLLIEKGADPKKKNGYGQDALAIAVFHGNKNIAEYYIDNLKMDPETIVTPREGDTLLMHAAKKGLYDMVKMLLARGADKTKKSRTGMKAADYAASSQIGEVLGLLKDKDEKVYDVTKASMLVYSAYTGDTEEIKKAVDDGADPNVSYLARGGQISDMATDAISGLFVKMINTGVVTSESVTPLTVAAAKGTLEAARYLISRGAKPDFGAEKGGHTPLMVAISFRNFDIAELLIKSGANVNARSLRGDTPLILAVHTGADEIVKMLLEKGADIDAADREGKTAVLHALESCNYSVIQKFKDKGVDIKKLLGSQTGNTDSPLDGAIALENVEMVKYLIDLGADVNFKSKFSWTPLKQAANSQNGYYAIAKILIDAGAKVTTPFGLDNYSDNPGIVTVMKDAIEYDFLELVKLFIERGHELNRINIIRALGNGRSPRVKEFFSELGLSDFPNYSEHPWNMKGFPYELGKKIRKEFNKKNGNNEPSKEKNIEKAEKEDIEIKSASGETALEYIIRYNDYETIARMLIDAGAAVNVGRSGYSHPLTKAIHGRNITFCEYLISKGANVNYINANSSLPLLEAIKAGDRKIYDLLISKGADAPLGTTEVQSLLASCSERQGEAKDKLELFFDFAKRKNMQFEKDGGITKNIIECCQPPDLKYFHENKMYGIDKVDTATVLLLSNSSRDNFSGHREGGFVKAIFIAKLIKMNPEDFYNEINKTRKEKLDYLGLASFSVSACNAEFARYYYSRAASSKFNAKSQLIVTAMHSNDPDVVEFGMDLISESDTEHIYDQCSMAHGVDGSVACLLKNGRVESVKKFLAKHPELKRRYFSFSLVYPVLVKKDYDTLKYILENITDASGGYEENNKITEFLIGNSDEKYTKLLKTAGFDISGKCGSERLYKYISDGNLEKFKKALESGIGAEHLKIKANDNLLNSAVRNGRIDFAKYLIGKGHDVNENDYISEALGRGDTKMADYLISCGAKYKSLTAALEYAIQNEDYEMIDFVFARGIDTDYQTYSGSPALQAVKSRKTALMEKLIAKGICLKTPFKEEKQGYNPGDSELFHAGGMSSLRKQEERSTLLIIAIENRDPEMAKLLAGHVPDLNQIGTNGRSALELAIQRNYTSVALEIIKRKEFDPGLPCAKKAMRLAVLMDNAPVIEALAKKRAGYDELTKAEAVKKAIVSDGRGAALAAMATMGASNVKSEEIYKTLLAAGVSSGEILFDAVRVSDTALIDFSLAAGASANYAHADKRTPLTLAVESGNSELTKKLILHGANANGCDPYERPLIVLATQKHGLELVKALAENGANIDAATPFGLTALYAAFRSGKGEISKYLLGRKANTQKAMISAIGDNEFSIVKTLLDNGSDPNANADGEYPLAIAKKKGLAAIVALLKSKGANEDYEKRTAETEKIFERMEKCKTGYEFAQALALVPDINIKNSRGESLLSKVLSNWSADENAINYVISRGADLNEKFPDGRTTLMRLIDRHVRINDQILGKIKEPGAVNIAGQTAMFFCIGDSARRNIEILKNKGLDINHRDSAGNTPLLGGVAQYANVEAIRALVDNGADVKARNKEGKNIIMILVDSDECRGDVSEIIKFLHAKGTEINQTDNAGNTALHFACKKDNVSGVRLLLSLGADLKIKNRDGKTPFALNIDEQYYNKVAPILMRAGANVEIDAKKALEPEGLRDLMDCRNETTLRTLIDKNIDRFPELDEKFLEVLLSGYRDDKAMLLVLQIARKRGLKPEFLWKLIFEKIRSQSNAVTGCVLNNGNRELIEFLISKGVSLDYKNAYTDGLKVAAEAGNIDAIEFLLEKEGKKTSENEIKSVIGTALSRGHNDAAFSMLGWLGGTAEVEEKRKIYYRLIDNENIDGLKTLVEKEKNEKSRHNLKIEIMNHAGNWNRPEFFKSLVNDLDLASDSRAIEIIDRKKWNIRLK